MRAAAVDLLTGYGAAAGLKLQVYPARPRSIAAPCAFVDQFSESVVYSGPAQIQRTPRCEVIVLHGLFDGKEAADQGDAFVDGFLDWVTDRVHAAGGNTTIAAIEIEDEPTFVPDWQPVEAQRTYFGTRITLEGYAGS